jgi:hypothetical protein
MIRLAARGMPVRGHGRTGVLPGNEAATGRRPSYRIRQPPPGPPGRARIDPDQDLGPWLQEDAASQARQPVHARGPPRSAFRRRHGHPAAQVRRITRSVPPICRQSQFVPVAVAAIPNGIFCVVASGLPAERAESLRDLPCSDVWAPITTQALAVLFVVDADARPVSGSGSGQEDPGTARVGPVDPSAAPLAPGSRRCDATAGPAA